MFGKPPDRIIKRSGRRSEPQESQQQSTQQEASLSPQDRYNHAKAIYEETRDPEHWQYMQRCADRLND